MKANMTDFIAAMLIAFVIVSVVAYVMPHLVKSEAQRRAEAIARFKRAFAKHVAHKRTIN
jgi:hypothetical protein